MTPPNLPPPADTSLITVRACENPKEWRRQYNILNRERKRLYWEANKEEFSQKRKADRAARPGDYSEMQRRSYEKNKPKRVAYHKEYRAGKGRSLINSYQTDYIRRKREEDPVFRESHRIRGMLRRNLSRPGIQKKPGNRFEKIFGCDKNRFREHIESLFEPWMNWDNRGTVNGRRPTAPNHAWDFDHIIPMNTAKTVDDVIMLNHHSNIRPLCAWKNCWPEKLAESSEH